MIKVQAVKKHFGSVEALQDVSFEIKQGEVVGFLGQNGAGKTTLMRILTTYLSPTSGQVKIAGMDIRKDFLAIRRMVGYLPETPPLYPNMTVHDYLKFAAQLKGVPARETRSHVDRVLNECQLMDVASKAIYTLSKGYKQRVGIAQAIIHEPEILILDEPTNGLDPVQILQVRRLIGGLKNKRTVIISTHILSEIELTAQRVIILKGGRIAADDTLRRLLQDESARRKILVRARGDRFLIEKELKQSNTLNVIRLDSSGDMHHIEIEITGDIVNYNEAAEKIMRAEGQILSIQNMSSSLEGVFLKLTTA